MMLIVAKERAISWACAEGEASLLGSGVDVGIIRLVLVGWGEYSWGVTNSCRSFEVYKGKEKIARWSQGHGRGLAI